MGTWWVKSSELNDEQKTVITLDIDKSHLVVGPPGSGKSNLLLLRGQYLIRAGRPNIAIVSFTRTLQEFMRLGGAQYKLPAERVFTLRQWQRDLLWQYGVKLEKAADFKAERAQLVAAVTDVIKKRGLKRLYDAVLLDEAQDYSSEEINTFRTLANSVFAVADSKQQIYEGVDVVSMMKNDLGSAVQLKFHYRNGMAICRVADKIAKVTDGYLSLEDTAQYNEKALPSRVQSSRHASIDEQIGAALASVRLQLKAYPDEYIGILCPRREELAKVAEKAKLDPALKDKVIHLADEDYAGVAEPGRSVWLCTTHSAKGLEFRALHILGAEFFKKFPTQRNLTYVSVTRAKTSLNIYHTDALAGYLESALAPPKKAPSVDDLFGEEN